MTRPMCVGLRASVCEHVSRKCLVSSTFLLLDLAAIKRQTNSGPHYLYRVRQYPVYFSGGSAATSILTQNFVDPVLSAPYSSNQRDHYRLPLSYLWPFCHLSYL